MSKDILYDALERRNLASLILNSVIREVPGVLGFLGIGSFWEKGQLARHGGSEKDIDLIAIIDDGINQEQYKDDLVNKIKEKFVKEGITDLKVDLGTLSINEEFDLKNALDPGWLFTIKESVLVCGKEPKNLKLLDKSDFPAIFIG